jgi:hypothetical protein
MQLYETMYTVGIYWVIFDVVVQIIWRIVARIYLRRLARLQTNPLSCLVFEINFGEVGIVDVHFADGIIELGSIEVEFCLSVGEVTFSAEGTSENSMKNLVTSPLSKISILRICPCGEKREYTISLVISSTIVS